MIFGLVFLVLAAVSQTHGDEIPIDDCGSLAEIKKITFDGCSGFPCVVHHGSHATGQATLVARSTTNSLTCQISGQVGIIELPFNGCPKDACLHMLTGDCPVEDGEELVYDMDIEILNTYPTIEITGIWKLLDDAGAQFLCFKVPMKIEP